MSGHDQIVLQYSPDSKTYQAFLNGELLNGDRMIVAGASRITVTQWVSGQMVTEVRELSDDGVYRKIVSPPQRRIRKKP